MIIFIINCGVVIVMNPFVFVAYFKSKRLQKSTTNIFIVNACLADLIFGLSFIIYASCRLFYTTQYEMALPVQILFRASIVAASITMTMSIINVFFIGID